MFIFGIINFSAQIKKCCAQTVADLERKKRAMGEGAALGRQERVE